jgi:putative transposase
LGYYVSFGDPSIFTCGRTVANAVLPKQPVLDHLGIELPYPMRGFFRRLHADQAKPHRAEAFRRACLRNSIDPDVRKPGPAHHGGHIERLIGTMVGKMRVLPGATGSNTSARDGYDAEKDAAMTLSEFEEWLVLQIIDYHHTPHTALDELCPQQAWDQAVLDHGPLLPISLDAEKLFLQFLPTMERTVQSRGVQIDFRFYWHPKLANRIGQKITVSYDRRTVRHVYIELEDEEFITLDVIGRYPDVCWEDWEAERQRTRKAGKEFQSETGRAVTARAITSGYQIIHNSRVRTRETRAQLKRQEREGMAIIDLRRKVPSREEPKPQWLAPSEISNDNWLKDLS